MAESLLDKYRRVGVDALSPVELVALAFCRAEFDSEAAVKVARDFVQSSGGVRDLGSAPPDLLAEKTGLRGLDAARFFALIELGRRIAAAGRGERISIKGPEDVEEAFSDLRDERREHFCALLLDSKNQVLKKKTVHIGTLSASMVGAREFFREAIREGAASVIAVHNHPSGDPTPSPEDFEVTKALAEAGKLLDIPLLDHVIIGEGEIRSMQRLGAIG